MPTVAFQGVAGAFSHLACRDALPDHTPVPLPTFEAVFEAARAGHVDLAMLPVENSQAGRVADIHRLLPHGGLTIVGEHFERVHHQLLVVPGASPAGIQRVRSHPQALAQCRGYLARNGYTAEVAADTAGAAEEVAEVGDPTVAAIASALAGETYGLEVLDANIEDDHENTTRFLIMAVEAPPWPVDTPDLVTTCLFRVRNIPAALYKALGGFATNGVNLYKLESYQLPGFQWAQFVIDFAGHPDSVPCDHALQELAFFSDHLDILGTYPAHDVRLRALAEG